MSSCTCRFYFKAKAALTTDSYPIFQGKKIFPSQKGTLQQQNRENKKYVGTEKIQSMCESIKTLKKMMKKIFFAS